MKNTYQIGEKSNRPWGDWEVLDIDEGYVVKRIRVFPKKRLSLQMHNYRDEHWIIVRGNPSVVIGNEIIQASSGNTFFVAKGEKHRIDNQTDAVVVLIEVQTGIVLDEKDIIRIESDY